MGVESSSPFVGGSFVEEALPFRMPFVQQADERFLVCMAQETGQTQQFSRRPQFRIGRQLVSCRLHLVELAVLERIGGEPVPQAFQPVADDAENPEPLLFERLDPFDMVADPLLPVDEFVPQDVSRKVVLDGDHAEIPAPVGGVHHGDDGLWLKPGARLVSEAPQCAADGTSRYSKQTGNVPCSLLTVSIKSQDVGLGRLFPA